MTTAYTDTKANETTIQTEIGPFRLICWGDTIVLLESERHQRHTINRVEYSVRVDLEREPAGQWKIAYIYAHRTDRYEDASPAARKRIASTTLDAVQQYMTSPAGQILWQHGYAAIAEQRASTLRGDIQRLERELEEKRAELTKQENCQRWALNMIETLTEQQQTRY